MDAGFLLINKPKGWTSHDVVDYLRRVTKIKKIGHSGTLDPFATGLLILGISRPATKKLDTLKNKDKTYTATLKLGETSTTGDPEGEIKQKNNKKPTLKEIKKVLKKFKGEIEQTPPMFSAKKYKGKKLYELARKGKTIKRKPIKINIKQLQIINYDYPELKIKTTVSTGTYIRTLAEDIGEKLDTGAYCIKLKRTKIGKFDLKNAKKPKEFDRDTWKKQLLNIEKVINT